MQESMKMKARRPALNPAFKLCQPLPRLSVELRPIDLPSQSRNGLAMAIQAANAAAVSPASSDDQLSQSV